MKLLALAVLTLNCDQADQAPFFLGSAMDLSSIGYFQRGHVRDLFRFLARTIVQRTPPGCRQSVQEGGYLAHVYVRSSGLAAIAVSDQEYPGTAAFSVVTKILQDLCWSVPAHEVQDWQATQRDLTMADDMLQQAIVKYQDPMEADKLAKIQRNIDETKAILCKSIQSLLRREEQLDVLLAKSNDLSMASRTFARSAKKMNSCCQ